MKSQSPPPLSSPHLYSSFCRPAVSDFPALLWQSLNFNDLLGGIVTLFVCTVGNNYNSIVIAYVRATGSKVCKDRTCCASTLGDGEGVVLVSSACT